MSTFLNFLFSSYSHTVASSIKQLSSSIWALSSAAACCTTDPCVRFFLHIRWPEYVLKPPLLDNNLSTSLYCLFRPITWVCLWTVSRLVKIDSMSFVFFFRSFQKCCHALTSILVRPYITTTETQLFQFCWDCSISLGLLPSHLILSKTWTTNNLNVAVRCLILHRPGSVFGSRRPFQCLCPNAPRTNIFLASH